MQTMINNNGFGAQ